MTRRERLQEQYEDALFALLMDEMAESEGKKALEENEKLKNNPDYVVSKESQKMCERTIARYYTNQRVHMVGRQFSRVFGKVAVVALTAVLLLTTAFAVSPTFRTNVLNLVIETFYDRTNLRFTNNSGGTVVEETHGNIRWLPDGFELKSHSEDSKGSWSTYCSDNGGEIMIETYYGENGMLSLDTEGADVQNVTIQALNAMLISEDDVLQIVWADERNGVFVSIIGMGISEADMIKVADNFEIA